MQRYNNLTPLPHDNFVKFLTMFEVSSTGDSPALGSRAISFAETS